VGVLGAVPDADRVAELVRRDLGQVGLVPERAAGEALVEGDVALGDAIEGLAVHHVGHGRRAVAAEREHAAARDRVRHLVEGVVEDDLRDAVAAEGCRRGRAAALEDDARAAHVRPRGERAVDGRERGALTEGRVLAGGLVDDWLAAVGLEPAAHGGIHEGELGDRRALEARVEKLARGGDERRRCTWPFTDSSTASVTSVLIVPSAPATVSIRSTVPITIASAARARMRSLTPTKVVARAGPASMASTASGASDLLAAASMGAPG